MIRTSRTRSTIVGIGVLATTVGCAESDSTEVEAVNDMVADVAVSSNVGAGSTASAVYALQFLVYGVDDEVMTYVVLTDTLDLTQVSLDGAREFPGYASIAAVDGKLLVSDGERPVITEYDMTPGLTWAEGASLSFANQGVAGIAATYFEKHWFVDAHTAYRVGI